MAKTKMYYRWQDMLYRCNKERHKDYRNYGGRGIKVCERWHNFSAFLQDMGEPPTPNHSLDRIDNNGPYSPENCRWATRHEQMHNMRNNRLITCDGTTKHLVDWARDNGINETTIIHRLQKGWPVALALFAPPYSKSQSGKM